MRQRIYGAVTWLAARHIQHFEANARLSGWIGAQFLRLIHQEAFNYHSAMSEQQGELSELKALSAALDIKSMAMNDEGWEDHHGIGLNMVASVLIGQHGWHPSEVHDWVQQLSDGYFAFGNANESD